MNVYMSPSPKIKNSNQHSFTRLSPFFHREKNSFRPYKEKIAQSESVNQFMNKLDKKNKKTPQIKKLLRLRSLFKEEINSSDDKRRFAEVAAL